MVVRSTRTVLTAAEGTRADDPSPEKGSSASGRGSETLKAQDDSAATSPCVWPSHVKAANPR